MRTFILATIICLGLNTSSIAQEAKIHWMTVEEVTEAMKEPRKIMMDVYTKWCGPCKMMKANTFTNPKVITYLNENYYAIMLDAEHPFDIEYKGTVYSNYLHQKER